MHALSAFWTGEAVNRSGRTESRSTFALVDGSGGGGGGGGCEINYANLVTPDVTTSKQRPGEPLDWASQTRPQEVWRTAKQSVDED